MRRSVRPILVQPGTRLRATRSGHETAVWSQVVEEYPRADSDVPRIWRLTSFTACARRPPLRWVATPRGVGIFHTASGRDRVISDPHPPFWLHTSRQMAK